MIRPQNDLDKAKKWSEKTGYYLPAKNYTDLYRKDNQVHKHNKEQSCPGNNCTTGSGVCNILEGEHESRRCCCKPTKFINYTKKEQEYKNRIKIQKTQTSLLILLRMRIASMMGMASTGTCFRCWISKQCQKEAIEVQSSPMRGLRDTTPGESLKELRFSPVDSTLGRNKVFNTP